MKLHKVSRFVSDTNINIPLLLVRFCTKLENRRLNGLKLCVVTTKKFGVNAINLEDLLDLDRYSMVDEA